MSPGLAALFNRLFPGDVHHVAGLRLELSSRLAGAGRVLDLGCGDNTLLQDFRSPRREVWGTDLVVHPQLQHGRWFRPMPAADRVPFPDCHFDAVCCRMVLEHVADPAAFLGEVRRVLRPGGTFVAHSISGAHYVTWCRRLLSLLPFGLTRALVRRLYGRPEVDTFPTFYRLNRPADLDRHARAAGLRPLALRRYADPGYFLFWRPAAWAAIHADRWLERLGPGWGRLYFTATFRRGGRPAPAPRPAPARAAELTARP